MIQYMYEGCKDPPQKITGDAYRIFNFGRPLPPSTESNGNSEFKVTWTDEKNDLMIRSIHTKSWNELAEMFDITPVAARQHYANLVKRGLAKKVDKQRDWSRKDLAYIKEHYLDNWGDLCEGLKRSKKAIQWKLMKMGLSRA